MEPVPTLEKNPLLPIGQDYQRLLQEGLAHLQHLSGQVWTDYNEHDPGVTLLEALCYTLTDVSRRAALPIPTLLARPPRQPSSLTDLMVPAREAFANHPVTLDDYRKLLLDRLHTTVKNAWLSLAPGAAPWHYQVQVELHAPRQEAAEWSGEELAHVRSQVLHLLNAHRNLGEVFTDVLLLQPYRVVVGGHLELAKGQPPTSVLAALLLQLGKWIAPTPSSIGINWGGGQNPEDLFAGPIAEHRLFDVSTFGPQRLRIDCAELKLIARQVPGVKTLSDLHLHHASSATTTCLEVPFGQVAVLDVEASLRHFTISQGGSRLSFEPSLVLWTYRQPPLPIGPSQPGAPTPPATQAYYADLGRYQSVQSLLPALYGTGEEGPPAHTQPLHRAYAMQLKGYLLLFDQLLANFCVQLENVGHFFSPTPQATTTYTSPLYDVPYVAPLLPGTGISPDEAWRKDSPAVARWLAYQRQPHNPYRRTLRDLAEPVATQQQRRGTFLAHLLARFGYSAQQYQARLVGPLATVGPAGIRVYENLLTHLHTATYHRGAARTAPHGYAESGLEFFLFLLTGLETLPRKWTRQHHLADLEGQVQLAHHPQQEATPQLAVRGRELHFAQLLTLLAGQAHEFTLEEINPAVARLPATQESSTHHWELELLAEGASPPSSPIVQRVLAYYHHLDAQLERFTVLDHLVLKPHGEGEELPPQSSAFYHFQATALLPGYALRFRPEQDGASNPLTTPRAFVENLVQQYAPAHVLVNILWLDYPDMREWETIFAALAAASPLLNPSGQAHPASLPAAQHRARRFLEERLSATR